MGANSSSSLHPFLQNQASTAAFELLKHQNKQMVKPQPPPPLFGMNSYSSGGFNSIPAPFTPYKPVSFEDMTISSNTLKQSSADYLLKFLYTVMEWSASVPFFNLIPHDDQIVLLQNCWHELFLVCMAQTKLSSECVKELSLNSIIGDGCSFANEDISLTNADNDVHSNASSESKTRTALKANFESSKDFKSDLDKFQTQIDKLRSFNLSNDEFSFLKSILIFNSGKNKHLYFFLLKLS